MEEVTSDAAAQLDAEAKAELAMVVSASTPTRATTTPPGRPRIPELTRTGASSTAPQALPRRLREALRPWAGTRS
ncbi:hypothetical protein QJS66_06110 [Kocuria rhizophila]|nr:hypothetical protein QJS66_06110 [Kocuria rhizophila]